MYSENPYSHLFYSWDVLNIVFLSFETSFYLIMVTFSRAIPRLLIKDALEIKCMRTILGVRWFDLIRIYSVKERRGSKYNEELTWMC